MAADLDPEAILKRVLRFAEAEELFRPGVVVVAVSGGQDSVCMLDVLRRLPPALGIEVHVAHLNHLFRGAESAAEAEYVRELAAEWGLPATVAAIDVPAYRARRRLSKQVAARYARYRFLAGVAGRVGAARVSVGHTADDAVETLLINLIRGSGLAGLRGIAPSRPMALGQLGPELEPSDWHTGQLPMPRDGLPVVVRPILGLFRGETEGYCRSRGLAFRRDPSNLNIAYRRNWIRAQLLPLLEQRAPGARQRLSSAAGLLADEYALVARLVEQHWSATARVGPGRVEFRLEPWGRLETAPQRQLLRRAVEELAGSLEDLGRVHVDVAMAAVRHGAVGAHVDLPGGVYLEKGYNSFWLARSPAPPSLEVMPEEPVPLRVPGVALLPGMTLEASLVDVAPGEDPLQEYRSDSQWEACLDAGTVGPSLLVRRRRPGDRLFPLGMDHARKLHDLMVDEKIPRQERDRVPLVATPDRIVWVGGYRIDDRFKITPETRRVLKLRLKRIENRE